MGQEYSTDARLAINGAQELSDNETCFVGIGIPSDAALLAKHTHAPDLTLIYESGAISADPESPPLSTGSPSIADSSLMIADGLTVFSDLQAGHIDVGLLSAAQVDQMGNLNSTVIGDYSNPKLRMVGSGGAHDIMCLANRVVVMMPHDPRRFVERVDFITSPGLFPDHRKKLHLGGGPTSLVTDRARFVFENGELMLKSLFPGFDRADAVDGIPWKINDSKSFIETPDVDDRFASVIKDRLSYLEPNANP